MNLTSSSFAKAVSNKKTYELLLLAGQEEYLIRKAAESYLEKIIDEAGRDFDYSEFSGAETEAQKLDNTLRTLPFLSRYRVVHLKNPDDLNDDSLKVLKKYFDKPSPSTLLVMTEILAHRVKEGFSTHSNITTVLFPELKATEREQWAIDFVKSQGKKLHPDAAVYLIETSSGYLSDIADKLEHALLYIGDEEEVTASVLMKISGISSEYTNFQLEEALYKGHVAEAMKIARASLEGGEALLRLVATHRNSLIKHWQVKAALKSKKESPDTLIGQILGPQIWKKHDFITAAQRISDDKFKQAVLGLLNLEIQTKSASYNTINLYYDWIWRFAGADSR